jgi:hypothetical protein
MSRDVFTQDFVARQIKSAEEDLKLQADRLARDAQQYADGVRGALGGAYQLAQRAMALALTEQGLVRAREIAEMYGSEDRP